MKAAFLFLIGFVVLLTVVLYIPQQAKKDVAEVCSTDTVPTQSYLIGGEYKCSTWDKTSVTFRADGTALWVLAGMPVICSFVVTENSVIVTDTIGNDISMTLFIMSNDTLIAESKLDGMWIRNNQCTQNKR